LKSKRNKGKEKSIRLFLSIFKLVLLIGILAGIPLYVYFYMPEIWNQFKTMEGVHSFLKEYKTGSIFVYIGLQIIQLVLAFIPGQFVQFAGGYAYSFWPGYLLSLIGTIIGTSLAFGIAALLGRDAIQVIFGEKSIGRFINQLNSKRAFVIILILFLIPGFPKDLITYAAGVSKIRLIPFLLLSVAGRTPAMMATIMMGSMMRKGSYVGVIILALVAVIMFILCIVKRKKLMALIDNMYNRFSK
jgi:uncharacterized membrane protein YdjX (TVP38/TMEM64 family)